MEYIIKRKVTSVSTVLVR